MANFIYTAAKDLWLSTGLDLTSVDLRAVLVDLADYTASAAHANLSDIPVAARVAISPTITGAVVSGGSFDTDDFTFSAVTGDPSEAIVLYSHTGTDATSSLIVYYDTGITNIPVTPNGGDITTQVNAAGWFSL